MKQKGFTLIEILVTLFITMVALSIGYFTYIKLLKSSLSQSSIGKNQIESLIGTSLLKFDVEMAGYGLPTSIPSNVNYSESTNSTAEQYNDSPSNPPRPIIIAQDSNSTSSYLVIKSAIADINSASQKWTFLYYDTNLNQWELQGTTDSNSYPDSEINSNFSQNDTSSCIILNAQNKALYANSDGTFAFGYNDLPSSATQLNQNTDYLVYGINNNSIKTPFNRVDYYLSNSNLPNSCDPDTYELYRSVLSQNNGSELASPILSCIKSFQVQALINNTWYTDTTSLSLLQLQQIQKIRIYILQQSSKYSNHILTTRTIDIGNGSTFTPSGNDSHYLWKVIRLSIKPMNLGD